MLAQFISCYIDLQTEVEFRCIQPQMRSCRQLQHKTDNNAPFNQNSGTENVNWQSSKFMDSFICIADSISKKCKRNEQYDVFGSKL